MWPRGRRPRLRGVPPVPPAGTWPGALPDATRQAPQWGSFDALMRAAARGNILLDPVTGAQLLKIRRPGSHEYAAATAIWSLPWTSGTEKVTLGYMNNGASSLVDIDVATLTLSNERTCPGQFSWMAFHFSRNPATPRIAYYLKNAGGGFWNIAKYDTSTNTDVVGGLFPKSFQAAINAVIPVNVFNLRLMISDDERWMGFHESAGGPCEYVAMWDTQTDTVYVKTRAECRALVPNVGLDEYTLARDGSILTLNGVNPSTPFRWTPLTGAFDVAPSNYVLNHQEVIDALHFQKGFVGLETWDPVTDTRVTRYTQTEVLDGPNHWSGQWKQTGPTLDKWVGASATMCGQPVNWLPTWILHSGVAGSTAIYRVVPQWFSGSGQTNSRFDTGGFVLYAKLADVFVWDGFASKVGSLGGIVADNQYYYDLTANTIYYRPPNGLLLDSTHAGYVGILNPTAVQDGEGVVRLGGASAAGGKAVKLWFHNYSNLSWATVAAGPYGHIPRAQISQCGRFCVFDTNEGDRDPNAPTACWVAARPVGVV